MIAVRAKMKIEARAEAASKRRDHSTNEKEEKVGLGQRGCR
jgi:hypothetical protein